MAEIWGMAIVAVVGAYGANKQAGAAKKGAKGAAAAADADRAQQQAQYEQTRQDQMPFMQTGYGAIKRQEDFLNGDMSGFENNAGFLFARQQGLQAADRGAAAGASYRSGGADVDRMNYATGLANQTADNYWAKLSGQAGQGYNAVNNVGQFGAAAANQMGQAGYNAANARASSYANTANAWSNFGQQAVGMLGQYQAQRRTS